MSLRLWNGLRTALVKLKDWLIDRSLGPAARAGQIVADQDAATIGLYSSRFGNSRGRRRSLTNIELSPDRSLSR